MCVEVQLTVLCGVERHPGAAALAVVVGHQQPELILSVRLQTLHQMTEHRRLIVHQPVEHM